MTMIDASLKFYLKIIDRDGIETVLIAILYLPFVIAFISRFVTKSFEYILYVRQIHIYKEFEL